MTIYALSTVPGKSGVAVVRVSGQLAKAAIKKLTKKTLNREKQLYVSFMIIKEGFLIRR